MIKLNAKYEIEEFDGIEMLKRIEKAGRICYKSEDRITDDSCLTFAKMLIGKCHGAMLEHSQISVKFIVDRGVTHELVRHRVASFAQESQRYCNYSNDKHDNNVKYIDIAPSIALDSKMKDMEQSKIDLIYNEWISACEDAERHYLRMIELGATPQIARSVLNNSTKTEIIITANIREWRHFFGLRADTPAHPSVREITIPLLLDLQSRIPVVFDDIVEKLNITDNK